MPKPSEADRNKLGEAHAALKDAKERLKEAAGEVAHANNLLSQLDEALRARVGADWERGMLHANQQAISVLHSELNRLGARIRGWL